MSMPQSSSVRPTGVRSSSAMIGRRTSPLGAGVTTRLTGVARSGKAMAAASSPAGLAAGEGFGVVLGLGGGVCFEELIEQGLTLGVGEGWVGGIGRARLLLTEELVENVIQVGRIRGAGRDAVGADELEDGAGGAE